jgi:hypothetical protein
MADNSLAYKTSFIIGRVLRVILFTYFVGLVDNKITNKEDIIKPATPAEANNNVLHKYK